MHKQLQDAGVIGDIHILTNPIIIVSEPGCQLQGKHADWTRNLGNDKTKPVSILFAVDDHAKLPVYPISGGEVELTFDRGEAVVFLGDTLHCGAAYDRLNLRLHMEGDIAKEYLERTANTVAMA